MKHTDARAPGAPPNNSSVSYEAQDINAASVLRVGAVLALTVLAALAVVWALFHTFSEQRERSQPELSPLVRDLPRQLPPEPRIQGIPGHEISPPEELKRFQAAADAQLNSYGWVDQKEGIARIPIREAMKRIAVEGLPAVPPPASRSGAAAATRAVAPKELKR